MSRRAPGPESPTPRKRTERGSNAIVGYEATSSDPAELVRLQEFLQRMKDSGVAKTREYNLPPPDTLGRTMVEKEQNKVT
jgi:hypothetical protein